MAVPTFIASLTKPFKGDLEEEIVVKPAEIHDTHIVQLCCI